MVIPRKTSSKLLYGWILIISFTLFLGYDSLSSITRQTGEGFFEEPKQSKCDRLSYLYNLQNAYSIDAETCEEFKVNCGISSCEAMLDVVYLWVNGSDPQIWDRFKNATANLNDTGYEMAGLDESRFRDFGQLKYSLRSVEKHLKWTRRIFIVTNGQIPEFLNLENLQIRIITHSMLKPSGHLPLFNTNAIQSMIHTIPGLSAPFLYVEDDIFFGCNVPLETLYKDGKAVLYTTRWFDLVRIDHPQDDGYKNSIFQAYKLAKDNNLDMSASLWEKDRLHINSHVSMMLWPKMLEKMWTMFPNEMLAMSKHTLRHRADPHFWTLYNFMDGKQNYTLFNEKSPGIKFGMMHEKNYENALRSIKQNCIPFVCLNDDFYSMNDELARNIQAAYDTLFPNRSSFEL